MSHEPLTVSRWLEQQGDQWERSAAPDAVRNAFRMAASTLRDLGDAPMPGGSARILNAISELKGYQFPVAVFTRSDGMICAVYRDGSMSVEQRVSTLAASNEGMEMDSGAVHAPPRSARRFELLCEGQVVDHRTGLIWSRSDVPGGRMDRTAAQAACAALELGGHKTWRLPTIEELFYLADRTRYNPAIDPVFQCQSDWHWTSTPAACSPGDVVWVVSLSDGSFGWNLRIIDCRVLAVRSTALD